MNNILTHASEQTKKLWKVKQTDSCLTQMVKETDRGFPNLHQLHERREILTVLVAMKGAYFTP